MPKCKSLTAHCIDWWQSILLVCIRSSQCKNKQCVTIFIHQHERERVPVHKHSLTRSFISMNMNTFTNTNFHQHSYSSAWMWTRPRTPTYFNTLVHQHEREHACEHTWTWTFSIQFCLGPWSCETSMLYRVPKIMWNVVFVVLHATSLDSWCQSSISCFLSECSFSSSFAIDQNFHW